MELILCSTTDRRSCADLLERQPAFWGKKRSARKRTVKEIFCQDRIAFFFLSQVVGHTKVVHSWKARVCIIIKIISLIN